jgi:hypothetical protein
MNKPDPIPARLAALKTTPTPDLKKQWRDLFDSEPPPFNRRYLESRIAYRIQELAYGGLNPLSHFRHVDDGSNLDRRSIDESRSADDLLRHDAIFAIGLAVRMLSRPAFRLG